MLPKTNRIVTYSYVDPQSRVTAQRTKAYVAGGTNAWVWTKRTHDYDGLGRLVRSGWKQWPDGSSEPGATTLEHTYDKQGQHLQNYDGTNYGKVWHCAGGGNPLPETKAPLKSPNADTNQSAYNLADNMTPQRRTYVDPATPGDQRHGWGQGRPQVKDVSGAGAAWATGTTSVSQGGAMTNVESRLMFEGTVSTNVSLATDAREKGRLGIFGTGISYAGSYGRVTSETLGRDINPLGRGDGMAYVAGWMNLDYVYPNLPVAVVHYATIGDNTIGMPFQVYANRSVEPDPSCVSCSNFADSHDANQSQFGHRHLLKGTGNSVNNFQWPSGPLVPSGCCFFLITLCFTCGAFTCNYSPRYPNLTCYVLEISKTLGPLGSQQSCSSCVGQMVSTKPTTSKLGNSNCITFGGCATGGSSVSDHLSFSSGPLAALGCAQHPLCFTRTCLNQKPPGLTGSYNLNPQTC